MTENNTGRRTIRRYAHELYPHAADGETRSLAVEVPYLYARAAGLEVWDTGWFAAESAESGSRTMNLIDARRIALLADAMHQGLTGDEAWAWADEYAWDEAGEMVDDRALRYGVPTNDIRPYLCGPTPTRHRHYSAMDRGFQHVTYINGTEEACFYCTEPIDTTTTKESN